MALKLDMEATGDQYMTPIDFEVIESKVKVTVTLNTYNFVKLVRVITQQCLDLCMVLKLELEVWPDQ